MAKSKNFFTYIFCLLAFSGVFGQGNLVVKTAKSQLHVRETDNNSGKEVNKYLKSVNLGSGYAWCAAFVSWCFQQQCIDNPKSAWSPAWFPENRTVYTRGGHMLPQVADVFGIYFASKKRIAHVGIVTGYDFNYVYTIEGNTNTAGSREGDGVYKKKRLKRQIYKLSRWADGN